MAYRLDLQEELEAFHDVFHVSVLRKIVSEPELIISQSLEDLQYDLTVKGRPVSVISRWEAGDRGKKAKLIQICWERDEIQEMS